LFPNPRFQRSDPGFQSLVLASRFRRHRLDGFEFFARDEVHVCDQPFQPLPHERVEFGADTLCGAGRVSEHSRQTVKQGIIGLHRAPLWTEFDAPGKLAPIIPSLTVKGEAERVNQLSAHKP
jgi:hypothetical protein